MTFDLKSPATLVILVPDEIRVAGAPESTPDEVFRLLASVLYHAGDYELVPSDDPGMSAAVNKSLAEIMMLGGHAEPLVGPTTLRYKLQGRTMTRHVRVLIARDGARPKTPFVDYKNLARYGLEEALPEDLTEKVATLVERVDKLTRRATKNGDERDAFQQQLEVEQARAGGLEDEARRLALTVEDYGANVVCVVPAGGETVHETLRRRVLQLELLTARLREEFVEPSAAQRRRISVELENRALRDALRSIIGAATEGRAFFSPLTRLRFLVSVAQGALAEAGEPLQESGVNLSDWASAVAGFCALLAEATGAPHDGECDCQGCAAYELVQQAVALSISWPTREPTDHE